jgi:hypothetical protein
MIASGSQGDVQPYIAFGKGLNGIANAVAVIS